MDFAPHDVVSSLFAAISTKYAQCSPGVLSCFATFFNLVGGKLSLMSKKLQIVIEVVLGEMTGTLESLRCGLLREN